MKPATPPGAIDPAEFRYSGVPIWCAYGSPVALRLICCMVKRVGRDLLPHMFGYVEPQPGHGRVTSIDELLPLWISRQTVAYFFADQGAALEFLRVHTTPKGVR